MSGPLDPRRGRRYEGPRRTLSGIPALILFFIPALIGWVWIISALWRAIFG